MLPIGGNRMILALTVVLAGAAVSLAAWFAVSAARTGAFGFHHLQWMAAGVLIMTGCPMLIRDWEVLYLLFLEAGIPHPVDASFCAAAALSTLAVVLVFRPPARVREAICRSLGIPCL